MLVGCHDKFVDEHTEDQEQRVAFKKLINSIK